MGGVEYSVVVVPGGMCLLQKPWFPKHYSEETDISMMCLHKQTIDWWVGVCAWRQWFVISVTFCTC